MTADPATIAPDWSRIPFDVACARCGQDLRGLNDPKCPACELTFDWAEAVPVEELLCEECGYHLFGLTDTRCPECGEAFTWNEVFAARIRRKSPFFEYQWRHRPVRSFFASTSAALRPSRLWKSAMLHDRPRTGSLLLLAGLWLVGGLAILASGRTASYLIYSNRWTGSRTIAQMLWDMLTIANSILRDYGACMVCWWALSLATLLIFRQSMQRYRVRFPHVLRVWCYSSAIALVWIPLITISVSILRDVREFLPWGLEDLLMILVFPIEVLPLFFLLAGAWIVWSVRCGYMHYMHMDHPLAVAVASQVIAVLATATAMVIF